LGEELEDGAEEDRQECLSHWEKSPHVKPTCGAPSSRYIAVYNNSGILQSMDAVNSKEQTSARAIRRLCLIVLAALSTCPVQAQQLDHAGRGTSSTAENSLRTFLQTYLGSMLVGEDTTTRYQDTFVDLSGDGIPEVIVFVTGEDWCGSGGCEILVLARKGPSYTVVTRMTVSRPPIRVLIAKTKGWHDIGVWVQGGGNVQGYEAELQFDGSSYPTNPSVLPARPLTGKAPGKVVIRSYDGGRLLYP